MTVECERSNSGFDYLHRFTTSFLWDIPAPKEWKSDYRVVTKVTEKGGAVSTAATFVVTAGQTGAAKG